MSNRTRTNIDDFALRFMLSELNAKQFLNEYLTQFNNDKVLILERLEVLKDYFDNKLHDKEFEDLQEIIIANIPIHTNKFKVEKLKTSEQNLYFDELRIEALETRERELSELINTILPNYIQRYDKNNEIEEFSDGSIKGLNYKGNFEFIVKFHKSLERNGYIEIEYEDFKKFFKDRFIPNEKKIYWKKPLYHFYYLVQKIAESEKGKPFDFDRNNYLDIIPNMVVYKNKFSQEIEFLSKEKYSRNNAPLKNTTLLDKILKNIL
jgi:hypothetical protein